MIGYDLTHEQWKIISNDMLKYNQSVLFDSAYQGFASGDAEIDSYPLRLFVEEGHNILLAQSFAKNFGLYGERIGTLSVITNSEHETLAVTSQLKKIARAMYSNPPIHGARIVAEILNDEILKSLWEYECKNMADRFVSNLYDSQIMFATNL